MAIETTEERRDRDIETGLRHATMENAELNSDIRLVNGVAHCGCTSMTIDLEDEITYVKFCTKHRGN